MVISAVLFIGFVLATGAVVVKAYEWLQDVLYGPRFLLISPFLSR